jgi:tellurite resistance protein
MSVRSNFNDSEWELLEKSAFWVFHSVANADGVIDKKEKKAFLQVLQNHREFNNELTKEVLMSVSKNYNEDSDIDANGMEEGFKKLNSILEEKANYKDALNYKKTLIAIGIYIGNSSGGMFSSKFSDEEVEALKKVGLMLGVTENQLQQPPSIKDLIDSIKR